MSAPPGNRPLEYGYFDAYCSTSTTCSGAQSVAKPSRSAAIATPRSTEGSTVAPMPTAKNPTFMLHSLRRAVMRTCRDCFASLAMTILRGHCEERRDEAILIQLRSVHRDCFASLAMTLLWPIA